ncbi:unnamed protein product [Vitrella brassicaformis CCMP3155]|uniref:Uncharacterized protein n=1 Tax=Vitrella brassicaformis (strain CCMP3155) TaxID=1169540 RepID=A0A0G4GS46_VITBC|nr:unnamed protein product [Vitrella brassicaformis CCMP3155]|eukprot:CEM33423.1 unnamed protein product [Vitrella brassicaformis CCMP3155]
MLLSDRKGKRKRYIPRPAKGARVASDGYFAALRRELYQLCERPMMDKAFYTKRLSRSMFAPQQPNKATAQPPVSSAREADRPLAASAPDQWNDERGYPMSPLMHMRSSADALNGDDRRPRPHQHTGSVDFRQLASSSSDSFRLNQHNSANPNMTMQGEWSLSLPRHDALRRLDTQSGPFFLKPRQF